MSKKKFLLVHRSPAGSSPSAGPATKPSPEEMQAAMAKWQAWKAQFDAELVDIGAKLKPGGLVYRGGVVTDGPFMEGKEIMGGYMVIETTSIERALEILKAMPAPTMPGASIEIREMAPF